ncbi:MAG: hypothetical protein JWO74_1762 [Solirubrobacterales bacterium]|jgi:hypothetical protein|nr:hypothetical protein [Solirubrobacterales bacterium]
MQATLKRLAAVAALGTIGILTPAAGASAAVTPVDPAASAVREAGFPAGSGVLEGAFAGGVWGHDIAFGQGVAVDATPLLDGVGQVATVTGPVVLTGAPILVINANNQSAAGDNVDGVQVAP